MLLCLDIGNSSISLGLFDPSAEADGLTPMLTAKLSSDAGRSADEYAIILQGLLRERTHKVTEAMIGSVVPQLTHTLEAAVRKIRPDVSLPILHIGSGVRTGISLKVDNPSALGSDIVTAAAAAVRLCGAPVIFVDYGTATVIGAVNAAKELIGVSIAPGLHTSLAGLRAAAAQIPYLDLSPHDAPLGKNTPDAVRAGLVTGTACMTDGMIERIRAEWQVPAGADIPVAVTGGLAPLVIPALSHPVLHDPDLSLKGLALIHRATVERENKKR